MNAPSVFLVGILLGLYIILRATPRPQLPPSLHPRRPLSPRWQFAITTLLWITVIVAVFSVWLFVETPSDGEEREPRYLNQTNPEVAAEFLTDAISAVAFFALVASLIG